MKLSEHVVLGGIKVTRFSLRHPTDCSLFVEVRVYSLYQSYTTQSNVVEWAWMRCGKNTMGVSHITSSTFPDQCANI